MSRTKQVTIRIPEIGRNRPQVVAKLQSGKRPNRPKKTKKRMKNKRSGGLLSAITPAGTGFLKCTMAPPDFSGGTGFVGIPDEYDGDVVTKNHCITNSLPSYTTGHDLYLVQLPIPGVAYFYGDRAAGTTGAITLTAVFYDDTASLLTVNEEDINVSGFRYASNVLEFIPTVNQQTWGGSIQVWKSRVTLGGQQLPLVTGFVGGQTLDGLGAALATKKTQAIFPLNEGAYAPSFNAESTYEFSPVLQAFSFDQLTENISLSVNPLDNVITLAGTTANFVGLGSFECTVMKFPALIASQTGVIRSWACVEYQVNENSVLYDYRHMSPAYDPTALAMLKAYHKQIPAAVPCSQNSSFWNRFVDWARKAAADVRGGISLAAKMASYVPGPIGLVGTGIHGLMELGHGL